MASIHYINRISVEKREMPRRFVLALDSFKGCLDSLNASNSAASGIREILPHAEVVCCPVADGGEGMTDMVAHAVEGSEFFDCNVTGPLGQQTVSHWLRCGGKEKGEAYIDFASCAGLGMVDEKLRNPLATTSFGVGEMMRHALQSGVRRVILGLGGSATVDAGLGALQALGIRLLDFEGNDLPIPFTGGMLAELADIGITEEFKRNVTGMDLTLLCDVESPFTGATGAARVFGPQKGAGEEEVEFLESGLERVRNLIVKKTGIDLNAHPGSGAAGGAAGGLMALVGGKIRKGASTLLDLVGFDKIIEGADLIITGEGSADRQTLMGKIPFEILERARRKGIPVWLAAGRVADGDMLEAAGFERVICINDPAVAELSGTLGRDAMEAKIAALRLRAALRLEVMSELEFLSRRPGH